MKKNINNFIELQNRIFFVIGSIIVFRFGSYIPIPGIDTTVLSKIISNSKGTILEIFNMFSGGALNRASIFTLGIMPYISASIIIQLLTLIYPYFSNIKKEGEYGNRILTKYTRWLTLILSIFQSIGISFGLPNIPGINKLIIHVDTSFYIISIISLVSGTIFLMWLSELINEFGLGNGTSLIIFSGIVSGLPVSLLNTINEVRIGSLNYFSISIIFTIIFLVIYVVIFIEKSQRNIGIHYIQKQRGNRIYSSQITYLPIKLNIAGVMPAIFASSVILFPATIISWFVNFKNWNWLVFISNCLVPNHILYIVIYSSAIVFFCFFYTGLVFNPKETSENLKKNGAFIPGIRPGEKTANYINLITTRLTFIGAIYITFICLLPEIMRFFLKVPFYFGGTSLLIVVLVIIEIISQIQTLIMSNQYSSILKKSNLNFSKS
ncbi:preprotein translocase subunit SecY [Buchnera aphidicola (Kurisakia onigurumii)]|uniref:preprotein translocase subunit SecY n=1 Tax=Buchnera aphidicola TaxID=9 RepID=UPI0031B71623